jgi:hypothetical protein
VKVRKNTGKHLEKGVIMGGMASCYGGEWRSRNDGAHKRFQENLGKINWKDDQDPEEKRVVQGIVIPAKCSDCSLGKDCPTECNNGSNQCRSRIELME